MIFILCVEWEDCYKRVIYFVSR